MVTLEAAWRTLDALARCGCVLRVEDGSLRVRGSMTVAQRAEVAAVRPALLEMFSRQRRAVVDMAALPRGVVARCAERITLELPGGGRLRVVPDRGGEPDQDRPGVAHVTWRELAGDPRGVLASAQAVATAAAVFDGYVRRGPDRPVRPSWMSR